ncbi:MmgE/PrpD family protein [Parasphingorhabdus sp. JC815]|uniref:MmgE/PrpD family protein n=1 Tax=Parasphingorhabdus sp. JC815 TaxID=3232140 RepID=UPI0034588E94
MSNIQKILDFACANHSLPDQARCDAERLLADTLAVGAAGAASPEAQALLSTVQSWGKNDDARIIGSALKAPAPSAAFFNGFAIHCLEWDAVHEPAVVHALSVVTAALLAASDRMGGAEPDAFLTALAVGVDIASGLGIAATGPMQFFRPATAGIIGASLAVARLQGLPREKMADVLGLAYSHASGTMQAHVEASIALPLQIANAARAAISSVDLVGTGMDGPHDALEGPFGYFKLFEPGDLTRYTDIIGKEWLIEDVSIKPFPSGRASHGILGAIDNMLRDGTLDPAAVQSVEVAAPPLIHRLVGRAYKPDMTPSYARLCLPFLVPLMLRDRIIDPRCFTEKEFANPALVELGRKVVVSIDDNPDHNALAPQKLALHLADGSVIERIINDNLGSPSAPTSPIQTQSKFDLAHSLAGDNCVPAIFDNPLAYATEPQ